MTTYTKTIASNAYIWAEESGITTLCDRRITDQIVDDFGCNVKIRVVTFSSFNKYGDKTVTNTDTYSRAYVQTMSSTDDEVLQGIYKNGEIIFKFKSTDESKILTGNKIFYNNEWYEIKSVTKHQFAGTTYIIDATVEKVVKI